MRFIYNQFLVAFAFFLFSVASFAQTCTTCPNQTDYGVNQWRAYVYSNANFTGYNGCYIETELFNRNWAGSSPSCAGGDNTFSVRFRMRKNFVSGYYTFTVGGDDGYRLSVDGGATWLTGDYTDHVYTTQTSSVCLSGSTDLVIEYYENGGQAQVSFDYSYVPVIADAGDDVTVSCGQTASIGRNSIYFEDNFSTNKGWTLEASWSVGSAVATSGCSGNQGPGVDNSATADNRMLGYRIGNCYETNIVATRYATSPIVNLTGQTNVFLEFYRWLGVQSSPNDRASIDVYNGATWVTIYSNPASNVNDNAWGLVSFDVSSYVNANFQVRFGMGITDGSTSYSGWHIDDLVLKSKLAFSWSPTVGLSSSTISNPVATVTSSQTYTLTVTGSTCSFTDNVLVTYTPLAISGTVTLCPGASSTLSVSGNTPLPTGGVISNVGDYRLHRFNSNGTFSTPGSISSGQLLVVGGGGGGGRRHAGGGGAGGVLYNASVSIAASNIDVVVGSGGNGGTTGVAPAESGQNGGVSSFGTVLIASGGGGGGGNETAGSNGASGGGGANGRVGGIGIAGQGNKGGDQNNGLGCCSANGAGGGGAGAAGANTALGVSSAGGVGISNSITGSAVFYGGGGGGGQDLGASLPGGNGGGGAGGSNISLNGINGTANTGGGGGGGGASGANNGNGGNGGSGVVLFRYINSKWTSSNTAVATIDPITGVVTALTPGTTTITFTHYAGCSTTQLLTVNPYAVPSSVSTATGSVLATSDLLWSGRTSTDWGVASNWYEYNGTSFVIASATPTVSNNTIVLPSSTSGICISSTNSPTISAPSSTRNVFIGSSGVLNLSASTLSVHGSWRNNGSLNQNAAAVVSFRGGLVQTIDGNATHTFTQLTLDKTGGSVTLNKPVSVVNLLTMTSGNIVTTSTNLLTIGSSVSSTASIDWTSGTVVGPLRRYFSGTPNAAQASGIFPVGLAIVNRYAQINFTSGLTTGGTITAEYKAGVCPVVYAGLPSTVNGQMIQNYENEGYWDITPNGGNLNSAFYRLVLRGNALSTVTSVPNMASLRIIKSVSHTTWDNTGIGSHSAPAGGTNDFTIANSGMVGFSFFNIGSGNANPLPITLVDFSSYCIDSQTSIVSWTTASEQSSMSFQLERSRDLVHWSALSVLDAAGNSTVKKTYSFTDSDVLSGVSYYRLKQIDLNGSYEYYGPISLKCSNQSNSIYAFPNPNNGDFGVEIVCVEDVSLSTITLSDLSGKLIASKLVDLKAGSNLIAFEDIDLPAGTYLVSLMNSNTFNPIKVLVF